MQMGTDSKLREAFLEGTVMSCTGNAHTHCQLLRTTDRHVDKSYINKVVRKI